MVILNLTLKGDFWVPPFPQADAAVISKAAEILDVLSGCNFAIPSHSLRSYSGLLLRSGIKVHANYEAA